ncbi:Uncharacterized copper-binding protein, cupredoxin-like subfamily [Limimonas halophila]|uniref:Uncharacterized copper-binding protein, cupredoxin-like subfamily n=1 Tax=Limimonas halophila TaxID=1082479 RepID=A0A1G7RLC9_9PROT|nr:plastocyanin/azurin family copper-binding protein [Limimonas halophila]SDG11578.1 Uncharacterized copper-binding protein, cupredoxin-like subfamily [Limimonas halophila]
MRHTTTAIALALAAALTSSPLWANGNGETQHQGEHHDGGHGHDGHGHDGHEDDGHTGEGGHGHDFALGEPGDPGEVDRTVKIEAKGMGFSPERISVQPGETVRFVVHNRGQLRHSFLIGTRAEQRAHEKRMQGMSREQLASHDDPNMLMLKPGETGTLVWTFGDDVRGDARFACHIPGHYKAGMRGDFRMKGGH